MSTHTNVKIYPMPSGVIENEIRPLITPYEKEYNIAYLVDELLSTYTDANGTVQGYGLTLVSDEERNRILRTSYEMKSGDKKETYTDMLTRTNLW